MERNRKITTTKMIHALETARRRLNDVDSFISDLEERLEEDNKKRCTRKKERLEGEAFWERFDNLLGKRKISLVCEAMGINYATLHGMKQRKAIPRLHQIVAMADYFDMTIDEFLFGE